VFLAKRIPLLAEEGWLRHKENAAKPPKRRRRGGQTGILSILPNFSWGFVLLLRLRAIALALRSGSRFAPGAPASL